MIPDKEVLLFLGDGPESIEFYTSEREALSDWASDPQRALYISVHAWGASFKLGPFLPSILEGLKQALGKSDHRTSS